MSSSPASCLKNSEVFSSVAYYSYLIHTSSFGFTSLLNKKNTLLSLSNYIPIYSIFYNKTLSFGTWSKWVHWLYFWHLFYLSFFSYVVSFIKGWLRRWGQPNLSYGFFVNNPYKKCKKSPLILSGYFTYSFTIILIKVKIEFV